MRVVTLHRFHPAVARWFARELGEPTAPQLRGWPEIQAGRDTLIAAPTGSGKTLAAFLAAIDALLAEGLAGGLPDETRVLYVSPLKALSNDIEKNLQVPLAGISAELAKEGAAAPEVRVSVRTGDTGARERAAMTRRPPHVVVTTPESLYILLTSEGGRRMLSTVRTVIVDEIHAMVRDKRGAHLALSLERLDALVLATRGEPRPTRIGLSATQRPVEVVARFLAGSGENPCSIVDEGHARARDLAIEVPRSPLEAVMSGEVWEEVYERVSALVQGERTTLVFVNTRRLAERVARHLAERLGAEAVTAHHGSLSREQRLDAERRLKAGRLRALVATASLELGIDVGTVDLVVQIGTTRSIAALLQRVGRSGHHKAATPKGRLFPLSRDELVEAVALLDAIRRDELDSVDVPPGSLDILAQQIVAAVASEGECAEEELFERFRRAHPYRRLERRRYDEVVAMLHDGFSTRRGRRGAHVHHDAVHGKLRPRRGARLAAITSGGAIPDVADYEVVEEPSGARVGSVNEDFAIESMQGDVFQLGNASWKILKVEPGRVRVADARGQPPTIPFWLGEAPARSPELSAAVSRLRSEVDELLQDVGVDGARENVAVRPGVGPAAAAQLVEYLAAGRAALGAMPTADTLVLERFFDESGGMQLVLHSPFGSRINRAWGLSLRKKFCQAFNFELQAAATEDAIVLSLGPVHSFALDEVFRYVRPGAVRDDLVQAVLVAPTFTTRWRWNASRALAVLRWRGGKKVPPRLQRMDADDLVTVVFPDSVACAENLTGVREIPDHPLVTQTLDDCLHEAMDVGAFEALLGRIVGGEKRLVARDLTEPSPLAQEVLTARPYAFLDDAPLEERRTQAVLARRWLDPRTAADLGALDAAAVERVRAEAWPAVETPDELHDALVLLGVVTEAEGRGSGWREWFDALVRDGRAALATVGTARLWTATERVPELRAVAPLSRVVPDVKVPELARRERSPEGAAVELLRGRLESMGPTTTAALAALGLLSEPAVRAAVAALEAEGFVLRGRFSPDADGEEICERRLLARIHRRTLGRLRAEIEPVSASDFVRFLLDWHHVARGSRLRGPESLARVVAQLEGVEVAAAAWEADVLPARVEDYEPGWLDALCASGRVTWARLSPPATGPRGTRASGPVRSTPIGLLERRARDFWRAPLGPGGDGVEPSADARRVHSALAAGGASFFDDLAASTGLLRTRVEESLAELVARGLATSDSFAGLRALLVPASQRRDGARRRRGDSAFLLHAAGRWSLVARDGSVDPARATEHVARVLLRRWGVVMRRTVEREPALPPWRDLVGCLRRLEARGEIRGGRFVAGFSGEQFALGEAVEHLRRVRRQPPAGALVSVSAVDPLNVVGSLVPGERVPALASNRVLFRDGEVIGRKVGSLAEITVEMPPGERWEAQAVLCRRASSRGGGARTRRSAGA